LSKSLAKLHYIDVLTKYLGAFSPELGLQMPKNFIRSKERQALFAYSKYPIKLIFNTV